MEIKIDPSCAQPDCNGEYELFVPKGDIVVKTKCNNCGHIWNREEWFKRRNNGNIQFRRKTE